MNIKQLYLHDLSSDLHTPENDTLHIWTFSAKDVGNMHKNIHEYSRALLQKILSLYTGVPKEELKIEKNEHGKPYLIPCKKKDTLHPPIYFNLSHSGEYIVLVFSSNAPVGIDIEKTNRTANINKIASKLFLPNEAAHLRTLAGEEKNIYFFRCWTRTESFLKGLGTGFSVSFTDKKIQEEYSSWHVQSVSTPDGYICSVAYRQL